MDLWAGEAAPALADAGLVLLYGDELASLPQVIPLDRGGVMIGREQGAASVVLPLRSVSRLHAAIQPRERGRFVVRDLGSRNGVIVRGHLTREAELRALDEVRIGNAIYKFVDHGASAYAPYRVEGRVTAPARAPSVPGLVGGLAMARVSAQVETVAAGDLPVLVLGETGTGKELVARALHAMSGRRGPMRSVNCASIPQALVESELFGHVRGAFSGAARDHVGVIRAADKGTLFLDEIGDMPLEAQAKLLRVLETKEVMPVGAVAGHAVDVRVVSATHRDLRALVAAGQFRADLFARLDGYTIHLPPLRERKEDLLALVRHFLAEAGARGRPVTFGFMLALTHHAWPFNVRELASAVKRAVAVSDGAPLDADHLPPPILDPMRTYGTVAPLEAPVPAALDSPAEPHSAKGGREPRPEPAEIRRLLEAHEGNVSAVARALGKDRALVNRWIRADGVDAESFRKPR